MINANNKTIFFPMCPPAMVCLLLLLTTPAVSLYPHPRSKGNRRQYRNYHTKTAQELRQKNNGKNPFAELQ
jgi:hypothetical protein